jgi:hypothetical protein
VRVSGQSSAAEPRDASTVILARDGQPAGRTTSEPEVLLLRRHRDSGFAAQGLCLDLGALTYWSRWITPLGEHKRYDTRFFVARYEDELA